MIHFQLCDSASAMPLLLLLLLFSTTWGGNVLMYLPVSARSHLNAWNPLANGLALHGHNVTVVTAVPSIDHPDGVKQIVVPCPEFSEFLENYSSFTVSDDIGAWDSLQRVVQGGQALIKVHSDALKHPDMKSILHSNQTWDLVIASPLFNELGVMLGDFLQAPTILYMPVNAEQFLSMSLGHPDNLSWSGPGAGSIMAMLGTFFINTVYQLYIKQIYFVQPQYLELKKHVPMYNLPDYPSLERNADFGFYFTSPILGQVAARLPNTANLGFIHCRSGKQLPTDLQSWLDSAGEGVVYMSMGSIFQLPQEVLHLFKRVFIRLKLKVIWKQKASFISETMYQSPWLPQQDILAHSNVKIFISQVGMMSLQESIYHGVPILGVPLTSEQNMNAGIVKQKKIGTVLNYKEVDEEALESAIKQLMNDKNVKSNVEVMSSRVKDLKSHPLEDAIWWSEYVMRHNGCQHLQSPHRHSAQAGLQDLWDFMFLPFKIVLAFMVAWTTMRYLKCIYK